MSPWGLRPATIAAMCSSTSCVQRGPSVRVRRMVARVNPKPSSEFDSAISSRATPGRSPNCLSPSSSGKRFRSHAERMKCSSTSAPKASSKACGIASAVTSDGRLSSIRCKATNPKPMPVTLCSRKCSSQSRARSRPSSLRGSMDSSLSHVETYKAGSATSRCKTHALTPVLGNHEATRCCHDSSGVCTHAASKCAVPPGVRCSAAWETTNSLAPSRLRPESR